MKINELALNVIIGYHALTIVLTMQNYVQMELVIVKKDEKENIVRQKAVFLNVVIMVNVYKMVHVNGIKFPKKF